MFRGSPNIAKRERCLIQRLYWYIFYRTDTLKSLARDIYLIKHDLARALAMLDVLLTRNGVGSTSAAPIESLEHIEAMFPLQNDEQLSNLEEMLKHAYIKDDIVNHFFHTQLKYN